MASLFPFQPAQSIQMIYHALAYAKPKDKMDMILEPLQAMIQLALLSICPMGTKLQIQENILSIQSPSALQPVARWYHSDKKDDLYFLYSVIKRFIKWYNPTSNKKSPISIELYQLVSSMSMSGLTMLFKTYSSADSNTVIHVIQMYKNLLECNNDKIMTEEYVLDMEKNKINLDEVFESIIHIYEPVLLQVIYHTLLLIQSESDVAAQQDMIQGLAYLLQKKNHQIKEWIKLNLSL